MKPHFKQLQIEKLIVTFEKAVPVQDERGRCRPKPALQKVNRRPCC